MVALSDGTELRADPTASIARLFAHQREPEGFARPLPACRAELELGRLPPRRPESPVSDGRMSPSF